MEANYKEAVQAKVVEYLRTGDIEVAGEAFELLKENEWKRKSFRTAQMLYGSRDDAYSLYATKFMDALAKYDESKGDFINFVNFSITNAVINAGKKGAKIRSKEVEYSFANPNDDDNDNMNPEEKFAAEQPEVFSMAFEMTPQQKQAVMREIVRDIMAKAKPEEVEMLIAYAETGSMREVARRFDTNQVKVMRTIDRMQKYYDFEKYGDVAQYFTTNTTTSRGGRKS
jgi:DNA-directed RNA polymerase specialized sigma24 family protein